jgi:hypothetical protein
MQDRTIASPLQDVRVTELSRPALGSAVYPGTPPLSPPTEPSGIAQSQWDDNLEDSRSMVPLIDRLSNQMPVFLPSCLKS